MNLISFDEGFEIVSHGANEDVQIKVLEIKHVEEPPIGVNVKVTLSPGDKPLTV